MLRGKSTILPVLYPIAFSRIALCLNAYITPWLCKEYGSVYTIYFGSTVAVIGNLSLTLNIILGDYMIA